MMEPDCSKTATDEQLAGQSLAGCLASFDELVHRHETSVYRFVWQRCGSADDARDVTQMVFISAFRKLHQFHRRTSFKSWLFAIARNRTIDLLRARRPQEEVNPDHREEGPDPAATLEGREQADSLWALARKHLTQDQYEALWLRYQEELSVREIARAVRRTETGVKVTLFRARQKLAPLLTPSEPLSGRLEPSPSHPQPAENRSLPSPHHQLLITP